MLDTISRLDTFPDFSPSDESSHAVKELLAACDKRLFTHTGETEHALLYQLAKDTSDLNARILDVGTHYGISAASMALGAKSGSGKNLPVFTIDKYMSYQQPHDFYLNFRFPLMRATLTGLDIIDDICQIVCDSSVFLAFWNMPICLAFIDGGHDYEVVSRDISLIAKHLVKGGWLMFHDYVEEWWSGVIPAVNELIDKQPPTSIKVFSRKDSVIIQKTGAWNV